MSERYPSAEVISAIAREKQLAVLQQVGALDTKAATLIGLTGVVLGLVFSSDLATDHWNAVLTTGVVLLSVSGAVLSYALTPRKYGLNPDTKKLHDRWMAKDAEDTLWAVVESINRAIIWNEAILARKALALRSGTFLLAVSVVCIGSRLIYLLET